MWRPRSGLRPHRGGQRSAPLVARPQEQPLLPGPGKNDNKMLGRVQKTSRWSAERRGVGSLRRRALAAKVRARVRSCTHPDARSIRAPTGAPPALSGGNEKKKKRQRRTKGKDGANEAKQHGQQFIALSSPRRRGPITPGPSRGPCSWVPAFAGTTEASLHAV